MIGGIFETIGKTLGIGKEKYFLELDETAEEVAGKVQKTAASATKTAVKTAKDVSGDVIDAVKSGADEAEDAASKAKVKAKQAKNKAAGKASKADKAAEKAAQEAKQKESKEIKEGDAKVKISANEETGEIEADAIETGKGKKPANKSAKKVVANKKAASKSDQKSAAPEPSNQPRDPEEIIREAIAAVEKKPSGKPSDPENADTFSTDYLMPLSKSRRRPGPSFSKFKNMARETNPKLKS